MKLGSRYRFTGMDHTALWSTPLRSSPVDLSTGSSSRTSYIGREHDKETDLGFGACPESLRGRVRLYEPEYGRFLSTDVLWGKYLPLQPYQYAGNNPVMALDDNGKEIVPINLTPEQTATVKLFIEVLKNLGDACITQIVEYAQGKESRIHLYSMPRDVETQSVSQSFFGYETTIENMWQLSRGVATTIQNDKMARNGWADVVLGTEAVLENQPEGQALLAVLDELHHVYIGMPGKEGTKQEHIQLYSYLLDAIRSGALVIPGLSAELIERKLKEEIREGYPESMPADPSKEPTSQPRPSNE